ncbi:MAG TPA: hypothetical protein VNH17_01685, partial [Streptosporangiaceae bacterium]|nr:hypothetical protein [Streptosporangiaceae bacterium]
MNKAQTGSFPHNQIQQAALMRGGGDQRPRRAAVPGPRPGFARPVSNQTVIIRRNSASAQVTAIGWAV